MPSYLRHCYLSTPSTYRLQHFRNTHDTTFCMCVSPQCPTSTLVCHPPPPPPYVSNPVLESPLSLHLHIYVHISLRKMTKLNLHESKNADMKIVSKLARSVQILIHHQLTVSKDCVVYFCIMSYNTHNTAINTNANKRSRQQNARTNAAKQNANEKQTKTQHDMSAVSN
jgi:hypothetical protein